MKFDINELIERFGRGFLFANEAGYYFYCYDSDKSYYRILHESCYEGGEYGYNWVDFVKDSMNNKFDANKNFNIFNVPKFFFIDKDGNKTKEPVYYE